MKPAKLDSTIPEAGMPAPDFCLPDARNEETVRLSDLTGRDILLVFFRGTWCPFCRDQMRLLADNEPRLREAGITLLGIVCQNRRSVRAYTESVRLPFPLLADETREVARSYGSHYWLSPEGFNLARPSLFILDRNGIITLAYRGKNMTDLPVGKVLEKFILLLEA
ncbi:MAG: peroxiredoxin family protein [Capsulimonadales bacterium]|nr:peroxiredoxin family protein [Capsulimonadales bacterium]